MNLSRHAQGRLQKRGIPPLVVEWLREYGARHYDHRGAMIFHFDKKSRKRLTRECGRTVVNRLADLLDIYMVVSVASETVLTVAHRHENKRIVWN